MVSRSMALAAALAAATALAGCATGRGPVVKTPPACQDQRVQIYFEPDSAVVTREGRAVLRQAAQSARGCQVERVRVLGLADAVGAPDANLALSKQRADAVTTALAATGLPAAEFEVAGAGQEGAVTSGGKMQPVRRRAEVVLHMTQPK